MPSNTLSLLASTLALASLILSSNAASDTGFYGAGAIRFPTKEQHRSYQAQRSASSSIKPEDIPGTEAILPPFLQDDGGRLSRKEVPQYVLDHAPLVHLHEDEIYWPSLLSDHLNHTSPYLHQIELSEAGKGDRWKDYDPSISNLGELNKYATKGGDGVYLHSKDAVENLPDWLTSRVNIPIPPGEKDPEHYITLNGTLGDEIRKHLPHDTPPPPRIPARSKAPVQLILVEHEDNVLHAFWFFFYSYNLGNSVFGVGFGDHVGDWEHSVVRFKDGKPESTFVSEHAFGQSYTFDAMEKFGDLIGDVKEDTELPEGADVDEHRRDVERGVERRKGKGKRPVVYSAKGTHAMYATPGIQAYILPFAILHDTTSRGPLWDPTLNLESYYYTSPSGTDDRRMSGVDQDLDNYTTFSNTLLDRLDTTEGRLTPTTANPDAPTSWFAYRGRWGDAELPKSDKRQYHAPIVGEKAFVDGPRGPRFKGLGRTDVCPLHITGCKLNKTIAPRLWLINWLYNWVWIWGGFLVVSCLGIGVVMFLRHTKRGAKGGWKHGKRFGRGMWRRWSSYSEKRREKRRAKTLGDVERSPLLSSESGDDGADARSVSTIGGVVSGVEPPRQAGYGTLSSA